jgi:serine/threonine protein kinase/tetratricopeptide (TPR) repeat protein
VKILKSKNPQSETASNDLPSEYRFLRLLGTGGTSEVALVQRKSDGRQFAYKYFPPAIIADKDSATDIDNFSRAVRREFELTKGLNHPCVVPVSFVSAHQPKAGLLMPLVQGKSLIDVTRPIGPELLREIISSLAIALYYLELKSVAHGDIKPHNLFFLHDIFDGNYDFKRIFYPRLIDFSMGIGPGEAARDRIGMGTLGYGAPETMSNDSASNGKSSQDNLSHQQLTHQSDLFSLGVIAYYLACGRHPFLFETDDPAAISAAVTEYTPPRLDKELEDFPQDLAKLVQSMLAKEPALRPKSGFSVCETLEEQGAVHPFRRAIRPSHLLPLSQEQDIEGLSTLPGLNLPARNYLHRISNGDIRKIRIILNASFRGEELVWSGGAIGGRKDFQKYVWPRRLRQWERNKFGELTLCEARWIVRSAVVGDVGRLLQIIVPPEGLRPGVANSAMVETVRGDLSRATIKMQSRLLAKRMIPSGTTSEEVSGGSLGLLATLQLQAEQIEDCAKSAFMYCEYLKSEKRQIEALPLLTRIASFAEESSETGILIETLHRDADIRRDSGDMNGAESRYTRVVELSASRNSRILAETYKDLGDLYKLKQDFTAGLKALQEAERLYSEFDDTAELARVTNNMGNIYWIVSQYEQALNSYRRALKLHRKRDDLADISSTVNNIASIYAVTGRLERAIHIYLLSLAMKRKLDNRSEVARTLNNLGYTYYLQGKLPEALEVLEEALGINEVESSKKEIITNLDNFVSCAITAGRFADALSHIRRGRELSEELHDQHSKAIFDANLARILLRTGQWDHALRLALRSMSAAAELSDKVLEVGCLLIQAELYSQMQLPQKNALCIQQAVRLSQEIGDKQAQIQCILACDNSDKERLLHALELALASKAPRDIALCELALAEHHILSHEALEATDYLERAAKYFQFVAEDIDQLRFWRLWAEGHMLDSSISQDFLQELFGQLSEADAQAHSQGECLQSWKLEIVLAEVGSKCGEFEESYAALMRAMVSIRKLASVLPDKECVRLFTRQPYMNRMSIEIMQLKQRLNVD